MPFGVIATPPIAPVAVSDAMVIVAVTAFVVVSMTTTWPSGGVPEPLMLAYTLLPSGVIAMYDVETPADKDTDAIIVFVTVLITDTSLPVVAYTFVPSGLAMSVPPVTPKVRAIVAITAFVAVSITVIEFESSFAMYALVPSGVRATLIGLSPTLIVAVIVFVAVFITETVLSSSLVMYALIGIDAAPACVNGLATEQLKLFEATARLLRNRFTDCELLRRVFKALNKNAFVVSL